MRKVWIIVANATLTKIYKAENVNSLIELKQFHHLEGHLSGEELYSDRQGRMTMRNMYGTDTMEDKTSPKTKIANLFAEEIVQFLEEGFNTNQYERLYLIAKPPFLGHLHQFLPPNVSKLIYSEIHKDLTQMGPEQIREYLPPVL